MKRHLALQLARRCVQAAVPLLLCSIVFMSLYAHYRAAHAVGDAMDVSGWRAQVLGWVHLAVDGLDDPQGLLDGFKGTLWSMRLGGADITDPLAAAEATAASRSWHWPLWLSALPLMVSTLLLGKFYCSWICPAYLLFELGHQLRRLLRLAEIPPGRMRFSRVNKYLLLGVGLVAALAMGLPIFSLFYPPAVTSRLLHAWIFGTGMTGMLILLGLLLVFELIVSPRWWCRSMCPGGALFGLLGALRPLRVRCLSARCTGCGRCRPACQVGIDPVCESASMECDNCGACLRHCPEGALGWSLGIPRISVSKP